MSSPDEWLDDIIINAYFNYLGKTYIKYAFFSSFANIVEFRRWKNHLNVMELYRSNNSCLKGIFIPFNNGRHWTLTYITQTSWYYFDSLKQDITEDVKKFMNQNFHNLQNIKSIFNNVGVQFDSVSCGVWICYLAKMMAQDFSFEQVIGLCEKVDIVDERTRIINILQKDDSLFEKMPSISNEIKVFETLVCFVYS
jgi:Ulp1 family protease